MSSREQWRVERVTETGSTNADVADRFRAGEPAGLVLVAERQTAGRGRLGRTWVTTPGSSLTVSVLLAPDVPDEHWGWLPLLTGLAAAAAVRRVAGVETSLKWPNDVLVGEKKLSGILLERVERPGAAGAVVGIGINCRQRAEELPVPEATSLAVETGADVDREALLSALLEELGGRLVPWTRGRIQAGLETLRTEYIEWCGTLGQDVRVVVPGGEVLGQAVNVDGGGQLVVRTATGEEHLAAGDVVHVRPQDRPQDWPEQ